jgi:hypothetical protein
MKKQTLVFVAVIISLAGSVHAQFGRLNSTPFTGAMTKVFGTNTAFSADIEIQAAGSPRETKPMPGTISYDSGKSRFEMDLSSTQTPGIAEHMKAMGMDKTVAITRPDTKVVDMVFPSLSAYIETPLKDQDAGKPGTSYKIQSTELGRETVDGHVCVKNKVVVTDDGGKTNEFTVWNAIDLKKFPLKIQTTENERVTTMLFKNVKLSKPDAALFTPPADYTKYDNQQALMREVM